MSFLMPLPVGVVGTDEIMEFELRESLPTEKIGQRLADVLPRGIAVRSLEDVLRGKQTVQWVEYRLTLPAECVAPADQAAAAFHADVSRCVLRERQGQHKTVDLKAYVLHLALTGSELVIRLKVTTSGTARPDEVLQSLGLAHLLNGPAVLRRTRVALTPAEDA